MNGIGPRVLLLTKTGFAEPRDGGTMRVHAIVEQLRSQLAADVTAIPVVADDSSLQSEAHPRASIVSVLIANLTVIVGFIRIGSVSAMRWYRPRVVRALVEAQEEKRFDLRIIEYSQLLGYRGIFRGPVVVDLHNIESELMANYGTSAGPIKALVARYEAARLRALESRIGLYANLVAVVSDHDRAQLEILTVGRPRPEIVLAPNGVDDGGFGVAFERKNEVVFVAHLGWAPNVDGAEWLCDRVWPLVLRADPTARLCLVGRSPAARVMQYESGSISVFADVPSVLPFVGRARVATAPLLAAGGTRLKILEALSCGTPVVATPLGALGLEQLDPSVLRVRDTPREFAAEIVRLLHGEPVANNARSEAERFRWRKTLRPLMARMSEEAA